MIILLNFQPIAEGYEKIRNNEFPPRIFINNRSHGPYDILNVLIQRIITS